MNNLKLTIMIINNNNNINLKSLIININKEITFINSCNIIVIYLLYKL